MSMTIENILKLEAANGDRVHLHYCSDSSLWKAYDQSAINLIGYKPELMSDRTEELFEDYGIKLYCVTINEEQTIAYSLPYYCTLLGDDYIELTLRQEVLDANMKI